jgi:hypothetical protein
VIGGDAVVSASFQTRTPMGTEKFLKHSVELQVSFKPLKISHSQLLITLGIIFSLIKGSLQFKIGELMTNRRASLRSIYI